MAQYPFIQNNSPRNGALYIRVSTHEQEELSPDTQKRLLLEYAQKNNIHISSTHIYQDDGISGRKAEKRPAFMNMIAQAKSKAHPFCVILVWKYSRFARNQEESIVYKSMLAQHDVEVISLTEPTMDGPFGSLIERIIEWMDEYYSINLSQEVIRGMTERALRGGYQSRPPMGYQRDINGIPTPVPSEAAVIRSIFDSYQCGYSLSGIVHLLKSRNIRTRAGKYFRKSTVKYILENPFYTGMVRWNYLPRRKKNTGNEPIVVPGKHAPIISWEEFQQVQKRLQEQSIPQTSCPVFEEDKENLRPVPSSRIRHTHFLSGILICEYCTSPLVYHPGKNPGCGHFQCYRYAKGEHSGSAYLSEKKLLQQLSFELQEFFPALAHNWNTLSDDWKHFYLTCICSSIRYFHEENILEFVFSVSDDDTVDRMEN